MSDLVLAHVFNAAGILKETLIKYLGQMGYLRKG
jgi:hypothetical protein